MMILKRITSRCYHLIVICIISIVIIEKNHVHAMIYSKDISFNGHYYYIQSFGFDSNGDISFMAIGDAIQGNSNVSLWMCEDRDSNSIIASSPSSTIESKLCANPYEDGCPIRNITVNDGVQINFTVNTSDIYRLILLRCSGDSSVNLHLDYTLKNPGGHLPKGLIQLPQVYLYMTIISALLFLSFNYILTKNRRSINELHYILVFVLLLKLISLFLNLIYYQQANNTGYYRPALKYLTNVLFSFQETAFFGTLLLVSKGWRITRSYLPIIEVRTMLIILGLLLSVLLFFSFYNDVYFFLSLMILYLFMMPKIFTNITKNLRIIESHIVITRYSNSPLTIQLERKLRVFKNLRTAVVLYLVAILIVNSMRIIMIWYLYWITICISEPISLTMIWYCCMLLRPQFRDSIFTRTNLDTVSLEQLNRTLENILSEAVDPLSLSTIIDSKKNYDNSIVINFPDGRYSLGVLENQQHSSKPSKKSNTSSSSSASTIFNLYL